MPETEPTDPAKVEEFIVLLSQHDPMLTNYVMAMMPDAADAQDILQETKLALWRSMHKFQQGTNTNLLMELHYPRNRAVSPSYIALAYRPCLGIV